MTRCALLVVAALSSVTLVAAPAGAVTQSVEIRGDAFGPKVVTVALGGSVAWTNDDPMTHSVTSDQGFWAERTLASGARASLVFRNAGRYAYHCRFHPFMTGAVRVPLTATGAPATGWRLRWSSLTTTPSSRAFDVQIKRPGSTTWARLRWDVRARTAWFNPAKNGTYAFRARTRNLSNGTAGGWSPVRQVQIA
jgi:plastocyanin